MRIASLLWLLVTVTAVWLLAGEVFGRDRLLQLAAASVAGLAPMMTFLSASVTPDAMMYALWSLVLWLGVRILRRGLTWPLALALFGLAGAAGCVKATSYALIPAALFVLAVGLWRLRPWRAGPALAAAAAGAAGLALTLGVWKFVANARGARDVGAVQRRHIDRGRAQRPHAALVRVAVLPAAAAVPGRLRVPGPERAARSTAIWLQGAWGVVRLARGQLPADPLRRADRRHRDSSSSPPASTLWRTRRTTDWAVAAFFAGVTVTLLAGLHWTEFQLISRGGGPLNQGRYLLPLVGVAGLCVARRSALLRAPARCARTASRVVDRRAAGAAAARPRADDGSVLCVARAAIVVAIAAAVVVALARPRR